MIILLMFEFGDVKGDFIKCFLFCRDAGQQKQRGTYTKCYPSSDDINTNFHQSHETEKLP